MCTLESGDETDQQECHVRYMYEIYCCKRPSIENCSKLSLNETTVYYIPQNMQTFVGFLFCNYSFYVI